MSEQTENTKTPETVDNDTSVESRRKLLKASLSAGAFPALMSLANRPLACTTGGKKTTRPSGFCSMKMAASYTGPKCQVVGCDPSYWHGLPQTSWPCNKTTKCRTVFGYCGNAAFDNLTLDQALTCGYDFPKWCAAAYLTACSNSTAAQVCGKADLIAIWKGCGSGANGYRPYAGSNGWSQTDCVAFLKSTYSGVIKL